MTSEYENIGLRCGIEIHQQLNSAKLFCSCPSTLRDDQPDIVIKRTLRAVAGETGEVDVAAEHEMQKQMDFIYEAYNDTTCLVELDEEPPHELNKEALAIVLQVAKALNAKIVDTIQVMRKTVVDGSNTSGFQRTALVAMDGYLETSQGNVRIPSICIEEEAAKIIEQGSDFVRYRLDRLGIPLIEIGTDADIKTPEQAKETAEKLGMILRSTGKVKRGIGTIRQDVNISIKEGNRIEIKGAQDLKLIPKYVEYESQRQQNLLEIRHKIKKTNIEDKKIDLTDILKGSDSKIIKNAIEKGGRILGIRLKHFKGIIGKELVPGRRVGTEFSDYAKVKARVGGIFHSDELPGYGITQEDVEDITKKLECVGTDGFVIVADKKEKAMKALDAVIERANLIFEGVPKEVRKANPDGTTSFLRPIPGAARMYPETDVLLVRPMTESIENVELITDKITKAEHQYKLSKDLSTLLVKENKLEIFQELVSKNKNIEPLFIANTLILCPKEIKKRYGLEINVENHVGEILAELNTGVITKEAVFEILVDIAKEGAYDLGKHRLINEKELEKEISEIIEKNKDVPLNGIIGLAMAKLRGKADGKKIVHMIKEKLK